MEHLVELELAGEAEVLGEHVSQCHFLQITDMGLNLGHCSEKLVINPEILC